MFLKNLTKGLKGQWPLLLIFLLGLLPLWWLRKGFILIEGDNPSSINPAATFFDLFYSWFGKSGTGSPNLFKMVIFPYMFTWVILGKIGLSILDIERIWLFLLTFFLPGIFMYLLVHELYGSDKTNGRIAGFIAALLYVVNQYVMLDFQKQRLMLTFLPLLFFFWVRGLKKEKGYLSNAILFILFTTLYASDAVNFANIAPIALVFFLYFLFHLFENDKRLKSLLFLLLTLVGVVLINFWWIYGFLISMKSSGGTVLSNLKANAVFMDRTFIHEAFRFMGFWAFREKFYFDNWKLVPYIPYAYHYYQLPLLLTTYLIPFLAFSSLLFVRFRKTKVFFSLVALLGIFLTKGPNPPFGFFYQFLFDKIAAFSAFREPFSKFMSLSLFAIPILVGFFTEDLVVYLTEKFSKSKDPRFILVRVFPVFVAVVILANGFPFFTGRHIQNKDWYGDAKSSLFIQIPDYWKKAGDWFSKNDSYSRVLLTPKTYYGYSHNWPSGIGLSEPVAKFLIPNPIIGYPLQVTSNSELLQAVAYQHLFTNNGVNILPFLDLLGVKYVLQQNDVYTGNNPEVIDPITMRNILNSQKNLRLVQSFGNFDYYRSKEQTKSFVATVSGLDVYEVERTNPPPLIYQSEKAVYVDGKVESFFDLFTFLKYEPGSVFVLSGDIINDELLNRDYFQSLISLKNKPSERLQGKTIYNFKVAQAGKYYLLINGYLLQPEVSNKGTKYFLNLAAVDIAIPQESKKNWEIIDLGFLEAKEYRLETNLPVEIIKAEYVTSPLWLLGNSEKKAPQENPPLSFVKINSTRYQVQVENNQQPFIIVLGETFNSGWEARWKGEKKPIANHFTANGFANGWYLDSDQLIEGGDEIILEYAPQHLDDFSLRVSLITAVVLFICLIFFYFLKPNYIHKKNNV